MNLEGGSFARCVRHPSQFFTGFCSSCLVERLSNVDSVERSPEPSSKLRVRSEIVEISASSSVLDSQRNGSEVRVRKTLLSLFQLDDCNDARVECESKASTSGIGFGDISSSSDAHVDKKLDSLEDRYMKERNSLFCSNSVLPAKGLRWRLGGASKSGRFADKQLESKHDPRLSCDWRVCRESHESHDSGRSPWEKPRHSWDGSMMSKALTCSFACLEEPQDGSSRIKRRLPQETVVADFDRCDGTIDGTKADNESLVDEKPSSPSASSGSLIRERCHEEFHQEINVMDGTRKKSHRWSRVWDWSITSPFRDFAKKREHVLERSLSGTWQEGQKDKSESQRGTHHYGNGLHAPQANQCLNRNVNGGNAELQKFRSDLQRKREYMFGRSRSVHYPSPGNMDNGLLRFYLTPMRTSRRSSNNGRMQSSRFFSKGPHLNCTTMVEKTHSELAKLCFCCYVRWGGEVKERILHQPTRKPVRIAWKVSSSFATGYGNNTDYCETVACPSFVMFTSGSLDVVQTYSSLLGRRRSGKCPIKLESRIIKYCSNE